MAGQAREPFISPATAAAVQETELAGPPPPLSNVGRRALISGLQEAPQFNGQWCRIDDYDAEMDKYTVRVDEPNVHIGEASEAPIVAKLALANLVLQAAEAPERVPIALDSPLSNVGYRALISGLQNAPQFNGKWCRIEAYDAETDTYLVGVDRNVHIGEAPGAPIAAKLRLVNLILQAGAPAQQTMTQGNSRQNVRGLHQVPLQELQRTFISLKNDISQALPGYTLVVNSGTSLRIQKGDQCYDACCGCAECIPLSYFAFNVSLKPPFGDLHVESEHSGYGGGSGYGDDGVGGYAGTVQTQDELERVWVALACVLKRHGRGVVLPDFQQIRAAATGTAAVAAGINVAANVGAAAVFGILI